VEAGFYAIKSIGNRVPGASGALEVMMEGIAKDDSTERYSVVNEYICSRVAAAVGLPVPPGTIAKKADGTNMFVSLRFTAGPTSLPPVDPAELAADHPEIAAGIVAFDCWVGNWDRHNGNIAYVRGVSGISIFDHGRTLLRTPNGEGESAIDRWRDEPHLHNASALLQYVDDYKQLDRWSERLSLVTPELIGDACVTAARLGACNLAEAQAVERFLEHRKTRIIGYLSARRGMLPLVSGWEASA
jgi:hypothetical protein